MPDAADTTITVRLNWTDRSLFAGWLLIGRLYQVTSDTRAGGWGFASSISGISVLGLRETREATEAAAVRATRSILEERVG